MSGQSGQTGLPVVHQFAAGIDIGSRFHVVAVPLGIAAEAVRTFESYSAELHRMAEWLIELGVTTVAMESTGVYWVPLYEILEERGLDVVLVNPRESRNGPGRKTDVNDAQWLQRLHACGLLRASFAPVESCCPAVLSATARTAFRLRSSASTHAKSADVHEYATANCRL
ncbi:IS110 family transposase [Leptolyngbya sp. 7M]|uniref:IS110 family transposase n=1 Tax=Leptolyngbya sp. 7M TaxID=2812896 RepID=UPI001B8CA38F|nr:transposase [Leptolyngbya sp. 7M]QYO67817.1 transposase [Leptolyngbya sp. 7M]